MPISILKDHIFGDMCFRYLLDPETQIASLLPIPTKLMDQPFPERQFTPDSLVQLKYTGDTYKGSFSQGQSLRNGESCMRMLYQSQDVERSDGKTIVITHLQDERGYKADHYLEWEDGAPFVRIWVSFTNESDHDVSLELLSSFSLSGFSPLQAGDGHGTLKAHRVRSHWSQEGLLESIPVEKLQLEPSWTTEGVHSERFGQVGSMPVNKFFPFVALEDTVNHFWWGAQIAHQASWQIEIYRMDDGISLSGGLADREFGHWLKTIKPGVSFCTPQAIFTTAACETLDELCWRLTKSGEAAANAGPASEQDLPIIFNEYCTTWGCPSHENITSILKAIHGHGLSYFVIDAGWYKEEGVRWDTSMGEYKVSPVLFPEGLEKTVAAIRAEGLKPGLWFEIENVGKTSGVYHTQTEHLLHRDGSVLSSGLRRFWDMRDPWVQDYLSEKVIGTLNKYGFEYMKVDYNETIGVGCDGAESLGEGLRQALAGTVQFFEKVKREVPGIILENCSSGGHRLEPGFMTLTSMASFSDAHECLEVPIIAANLHRVLLPRQSQIWAVIRKTDSTQRIAYSIANTFLGRMCLSGDVTELSAEQWEVIDNGIAYYKAIAPVIKDGLSRRYGSEILSMRNPEGWQALVRYGTNGQVLVIIHTFGGEIPDEISIPLEKEGLQIINSFSDTKEDIELNGNAVSYRPRRQWRAVSILCA